MADGAAGEEAATLEPDDVVVLASVVEKLREDAAFIDRPEVACLKDLLLSWGGVLQAGGAANRARASSPAKSDHLGSPAKPGGVDAVLELDSDEDAVPQNKEMDLPPGLLQAEFADEPVKDADKAKEEAEDPERLLKDEGPYPSLPPHGNQEPSDARRKVLEKVKTQAGEALARGDVMLAIEKYTEAIRTGGASASMLATRAALLLKQRRPCAAIRDCCAALMLNPDCGKAYHVRGVAHRKLGHWKRAHRDLSDGQRIDFSEESVAVHMLVAKKVGALQEGSTGSWYGSASATKSTPVPPVEEKKEKQKRKRERERERAPPSLDLRVGQAVRIGGLIKAPHLNGKRGIVQKQNDKDFDRWDVELRLERGRVEVKSIRSENIMVVRASESKAWKAEEIIFAEERKRRENDQKRWQDEDDRQRRLLEKSRANAQGNFPDMDVTEQLEAEMSAMPLDEKAMALIRRLKPRDALELLQHAGIATMGGNLSSYVKIKARQRLGEPDSEDDEETKRRSEQATRAAAEVAAKVEARVKAQARAEAAARAAEDKKRAAAEAQRYDPEAPADVDSDSDDEDFGLLQEEKDLPPPRGRLDEAPSDDLTEKMARLKEEAVCAADDGDLSQALEKYNEVIKSGGATALNLSKRAELLLKLRRPCAALKDCSSAIELNPDLGKAYRIRGITNRKLGRWAEASEDLQEAQRLDYDEGTAAVLQFVKGKAEKAKRNAPKRARNN